MKVAEMKTFLQSAIDCFESNSEWMYQNVIDDEQFQLIQRMDIARTSDNESSVYFLLFIAAERGEL